MRPYLTTPGRYGHNPRMVAFASRVDDWKAVRRGLGLSQREFAALLTVHVCTIKRIEHDNQSRHPRVEKLLRFWLHHPDFIARLRENKVPHPWPEDMKSNDIPGSVPVVRRPESGFAGPPDP